MMRAFLLGLALVVGGSFASANPFAVVQIPSHGGSGVFIHTEPGRSYILTAAHLYHGRQGKALVIEAPSSSPQAPITTYPRWVAIDVRQDIALIEIRYGPVEHVAKITSGSISGSAVSCGYDDMRRPAVRQPTRVKTVGATTLTTYEKPWHGRSGGGLIDARTGHLIGICQGYSATEGIYASPDCIRAFLKRSGYAWLAGNGSLNVPLPSPT